MTTNFQDSCESLPPTLDDDAPDQDLIEGAMMGLSEADYAQGARYRRVKTALVLSLSWGLVFALYQVSWGASVLLGMTALLGIQALRMVAARPHAVPLALSDAECGAGPTVTLVAAAKNEEAVIGRLVEQFCQVDYPADRLEVWIVDDNSDDGTPQVLQTLQAQYPQLKVLRRSGDTAKGGKSGALNAILDQTAGEIIAVFDADAQVPPDLVRQVVPFFATPTVGAVQTRKAICNRRLNFWTQGQGLEMMLDAYFQQQRIGCGGLGELRGNGQFIRRTALAQCGYFNEETITDDLDLTFRLHLHQWDIEFCLHPAVGEEGVTGLKGLWNQRNRWGEGGYQRYLDYWQWIVQNRFGTLKSMDCFTFLTIQYIMPAILLPDLILSIVKHRLPLLMPFSSLAATLTLIALWVGSRRVNRIDPAEFAQESRLQVWGQMARTFFYMMHWFAVIGFVHLRMAIFPKRLKWVKTVHYGESLTEL
jgi:1,2-diacylglycerol 3-beta-glucosyltransferase